MNFVALSSTTQHAMPPEFSGKWRAECRNVAPCAYLFFCNAGKCFYADHPYVQLNGVVGLIIGNPYTTD